MSTAFAPNIKHLNRFIPARAVIFLYLDSHRTLHSSVALKLCLCRYGRKALQEMYQVFLRRRTPNATATPAWMEELLKDMPLDEQQQRRTELFDVSWQQLKPSPTASKSPI